MPIPVIVAVGHTADKYILDEISKFSAKTPTDAGYILIELIDRYHNDIKSFYEESLLYGNKRLEYYKTDLKLTYASIFDNTKNRIQNLKTDIKNFYENIISFSPDHLVKYGY